jgi:YbbR domain-containing protein
MVRFFGLFDNLGLKLAALVIAVGAWWYVQSGQLVEAKVNATLDWQIPPDLLPAEPLPSTVTITVSGTRSVARRAQHSDLHVPVDLLRARAGHMTVDFGTLDLKSLLPGVAIVGFFPADANVALDEAATRKIKLKPTVVGEPSKGYSLGEATIDPQVVEIRGPRRVIAELYEARTHPIDVTDATEDVDRPVEVDLPWGVQTTLGQPPKVHISVVADLETRVFANIPVVVAGHTDFQTATHLAVTLQGPGKLLAEIPPDEVIGIVHLPPEVGRIAYRAVYGPTAGTRLTISQPAGSGARVLSVDPLFVEVSRR